MTEPMAADDLCEHHYETRILGGRPISVRACVFCRTPDWADLDEQAGELYRWGWQEGRDGKAARETLSAYDKPRQAQDGPQAPQDGPEAPDAGAETPDGTGGRQTGAEPLARLQRLRGQLAAEQAKVVRADQQPRPDLDHLRVTPHNGIAAGLQTAIFFTDHHLREAREEARTTPDNPATSSDTADNPLREQYAAAMREHYLCTSRDEGDADGNSPCRCGDWHEPGPMGGDEEDWDSHMADAALAVRDREMERLEKLHQAHLRVERRLAGESLVAEAAVERVRAAADQLHRAALNANGEPLSAYDRGVDTAVRRIVAALDEPVAGRESGEQP